MKKSMATRDGTLTDAYEDARATYLRQFQASSRKYINDFMGLKCAHDILERGLFPNAKEITESAAAYHAVKYLPDYRLDDSAIEVVCVGDGHTPRTAAYFAFRSKWQCLAIDPKLRDTKWRVDRLLALDMKIEDLNLQGDRGQVLIVAVHSHAPLDVAVEKYRNASRLAVIAIPCCVSQRLGTLNPSRSYRDYGIWSPKNEVLIWDDVLAGKDGDK